MGSLLTNKLRYGLQCLGVSSVAALIALLAIGKSAASFIDSSPARYQPVRFRVGEVDHL